MSGFDFVELLRGFHIHTKNCVEYYFINFLVPVEPGSIQYCSFGAQSLNKEAMVR